MVELPLSMSQDLTVGAMSAGLIHLTLPRRSVGLLDLIDRAHAGAAHPAAACPGQRRAMGGASLAQRLVRLPNSLLLFCHAPASCTLLWHSILQRCFPVSLTPSAGAQHPSAQCAGNGDDVVSALSCTGCPSALCEHASGRAGMNPHVLKSL